MSGRTNSKRFQLRGDSVPAARRHVMALLVNWKLAPIADSAALVVSELTTNAVKHAPGDCFELTLRRRRGFLIIEVSDCFAERVPKVQTASAEQTTGRGLPIVDAISERWGVRPRQGGKTVWAHLRISKGDAP